MTSVAEAVVASGRGAGEGATPVTSPSGAGGGAKTPGGGGAKALSAETAGEAMATAALADVMLQLFPQVWTRAGRE